MEGAIANLPAIIALKKKYKVCSCENPRVHAYVADAWS